MSAIRPDLPAVQPRSSGSAPLSQAQAAFFRAALGEVQAAPASGQPRTTQLNTTVQRQTTEPAPSAAGRSLRPGSLLDIKV